MEKQINQVMAFYEAFNQPIPETMRFLHKERALLRHKLLQEEVSELLDATMSSGGTLVDVADAITDCFYILIGTAIEYGIADKLPALFTEVHESNMSKLGENGKPVFREDGKVAKGPNYRKPNLKSIVYESSKSYNDREPSAHSA
jgi:predicted HAD superfamily Cof-like phosphohydrolase